MFRATATWTPRGDLGRFVETRITPAAKSGTDAAARKVLELAQQKVHVKTGFLRDSGKVIPAEETGKTVVSRVVFDAPYAAIEEFRGPAAGYESHAYLRPALDEARGEIAPEVGRHVSLALK